MFQIRTPIDDGNTAHWWVGSYPKRPGDPDQRPEDIPFYSPPVPELINGQPDWDVLDSNSAQDPAAWVTQGVIADRSKEHLGLSDKGIILFRRMLEENIQRVENGLDPMNTFRDPATNVYLWMETEESTRRGPSIRSRQGAATKHSPILTARGAPMNDASPVW
jgi:5,5'-dehydrodivanillate O-demethylase